MRTKIVGVSHGDRQEILRRMMEDGCEGEWVYLVHEEDNEYDKNAVIVINEDREILGYLKRDYALAAVNRLREGADGHAVILNFSGGDNGRHIGCNIDIPWLYVDDDEEIGDNVREVRRSNEEIERMLRKQEDRQGREDFARGISALIFIGFLIWILFKFKCI